MLITDCKNASRVFYYFEEISKIPHGSYNTKPIADYLENFARLHSLEYVRDAADNVIIKKNATAGFESRPTVIIQGHTDMVAEKTAASAKNMDTEGLDLYRDGDFLRAKDTTLGGDDGIAVAYALALLAATDIPHPQIEAVFTSNEEVGLLGADALDASVLAGKLMINIDSDDEGVFTVGCAGGARVDMSFDVKRDTANGKCYRLTVSDLLGGHSGVEIDKGRGNAIKLGAELLLSLEDIRIASIDGGSKDNAIPRDFSATFITSSDPTAAFQTKRDELLSTWRDAEPSVKIALTEEKSPSLSLDRASSERILSILSDIQTGIMAMSADIEGLVESSENLAIVTLGEDCVKLTVSVRSSVADSKAALVADLKGIAEKHSAEVSIRGEYPAWEYKKESHLREVACEVFSDMYSRAPKVITIHAGLECGIFSNKIEGLDCISIGPDMQDIHTTEERLSISSTVRVWEFILELLKKI